eukprot:1649863-Amphidinium_carterae.1
MSEIRFVISVTTQRNQRKVRTGKSAKSARKFLMVTEQVMFKGLNKASINAVGLNVKDFLPQKFKGNRSQFKPWADEVMPFLRIEELRLTAILKSLRTTRQPITDADVIGGHTLEAGLERFICLSRVTLSMTEGESHALVQSLIHTSYGYEAWRQLNIQYYGGSVARQFATLKLILSPTW